MDSWENDWADPFSDEPLTAPPPRSAPSPRSAPPKDSQRSKYMTQSGDNATKKNPENPSPAETSRQASRTRLEENPKDGGSQSDLDILKDEEGSKSGRLKKKWKKAKSAETGMVAESPSEQDAGSSRGGKSSREASPKQTKKKDDFKSFDQAVTTLMKTRSKGKAEDANAFVANVFDTWLQKSPIRRMFRPSKIEETKCEILGNLIKELKQQTLDEIAAIYYEQIDELVKQVKDEEYQTLWNKRIEHFSKTLIVAATFDYFNKIEGPGYRIIWNVGVKYRIDEMQDAVLKSLIDNVCNFPDITDFRAKGSVPNKISDFRSSDKFLQLNYMQLKDLFEFLKNKLMSWDKLLLGLINWLSREESFQQFQKGVFATLNECRFSKNCVQSLSDNEEVKKYPKVVSMLRTIGKTIDAKKRITVFSDYLVTEDSVKDRSVVVEEGERCCCMQQFDVESMTWLTFQVVPVHKLCDFAMCQYKDYILMIGGESESEAVSLKYDVQENSVEFKGCTKFETYEFCSVGVFKDNVYVTEGKAEGSARETVHRQTPKGEWSEIQPLKRVATTSAIILTTTDTIYIIHGLRGSRSNLCVDFNSFYGNRQPWETISQLPEGRGLYGENFCILDNTLCCIYKTRYDLVEASYDHGKKQWEKRVYAGMITDIASGLGLKGSVDILRVCQFSDNQSRDRFVLLCVETDIVDPNVNLVPNVIWYWGIDNKIEDILLPFPLGKRQVGCTDKTKVLYTIGL